MSSVPFPERLRLREIADRVWNERGLVAIANMRENGVRDVVIYCGNQQCMHSERINVDPLPDEMAIVDIERMKLRCAKCGQLGATVRPGYWNMTHLPVPEAKPWPKD